MKEVKLSCVVEQNNVFFPKDVKVIVDEFFNYVEFQLDDISYQVDLTKLKKALKTT